MEELGLTVRLLFWETPLTKHGGWCGPEAWDQRSVTTVWSQVGRGRAGGKRTQIQEVGAEGESG